MALFLHLLTHFLFALLAGFIVWKLWKKNAAFIAAFAGGFFIDLDHLIDYLLAFGFNFQLDYFLGSYQLFKTGKIFIFFHGWEYVLILTFIAFILKNKTAKSITLALALGALFHLSVDSLLNNMPIKSYSIIYRAKNNFDIKPLVKPANYQMYLLRKPFIKFDFLWLFLLSSQPKTRRKI